MKLIFFILLQAHYSPDSSIAFQKEIQIDSSFFVSNIFSIPISSESGTPFTHFKPTIKLQWKDVNGYVSTCLRGTGYCFGMNITGSGSHTEIQEWNCQYTSSFEITVSFTKY
jgi:hypothetical protein